MPISPTCWIRCRAQSKLQTPGRRTPFPGSAGAVTVGRRTSVDPSSGTDGIPPDSRVTTARTARPSPMRPARRPPPAGPRGVRRPTRPAPPAGPAKPAPHPAGPADGGPR